MYNTGLCNVVALCDVDMGAPHTQEIINMFPKAARFQDFRTMFDRMADKIDAVSVGVPDHSHFPITIEAMAHGKHVYVEKPMARTFQEIEIMMRGAKKYGVVTQMGNQGHSEANYFQFKAWKEAGIIKDVTAITAHMNNPRRWHGWNPNIRHMPMGEPVPETMDWDIWIGVAQYHDYNHDYHLGQWRCWYDFGMGVLGDWGAHILDTAHEFLDLGLPTEINPLYLKDHNPFFFPMSSTLLFKFPERGNMPAVDITWYDGLDTDGAIVFSEIDRQIIPAAVQKRIFLVLYIRIFRFIIPIRKNLIDYCVQKPFRYRKVLFVNCNLMLFSGFLCAEGKRIEIYSVFLKPRSLQIIFCEHTVLRPGYRSRIQRKMLVHRSGLVPDGQHGSCRGLRKDAAKRNGRTAGNGAERISVKQFFRAVPDLHHSNVPDFIGIFSDRIVA